MLLQNPSELIVIYAFEFQELQDTIVILESSGLQGYRDQVFCPHYTSRSTFDFSFDGLRQRFYLQRTAYRQELYRPTADNDVFTSDFMPFRLQVIVNWRQAQERTPSRLRELCKNIQIDSRGRFQIESGPNRPADSIATYYAAGLHLIDYIQSAFYHSTMVQKIERRTFAAYRVCFAVSGFICARGCRASVPESTVCPARETVWK
jgi:hypothetical protein